ncbi:hypothetical protein AgCh_020644 [Apium graveolens]
MGRQELKNTNNPVMSENPVSNVQPPKQLDLRQILTNGKYQFLLKSGLTGSRDLRISGLRLSEDNIRRWISELKYWRTNS